MNKHTHLTDPLKMAEKPMHHLVNGVMLHLYKNQIMGKFNQEQLDKFKRSLSIEESKHLASLDAYGLICAAEIMHRSDEASIKSYRKINIKRNHL